MAQTLLTDDKITAEALVILHQKLNFISNINLSYDDQYAQSGAKIGDTLRVRKPNEYTVRTGKTIDVQDTEETKVDLSLATQKGVDIEFSSAELTLDLDDFANRILEPAMSVLAANVESDALSMYKDVYNQVDGAGSAGTWKQITEVRKQLADNLAPPDGNRSYCMDTQLNVDILDAVKGLFQDSTQISKQYLEGILGKTAGFTFYENTLLPTHTCGSEDGNYVTNGAGQTGAALAVDTGTGTLVEGDVLTIADVYRVHPETKASTGVLQKFVVTADYAGGAGNIAISPSIVITGAKQNVNAAAGDGKAVTVDGTASTNHNISLGFHRDAFAFVTADLVKPTGVDFCSRQTLDGISMRIIRDYDINNDNFPCRIDVLYGYGALRPQLACRHQTN